MDAFPLPLSLNDIDTYLRSKPLRINRELFEQAIFALDDLARSRMAGSNDEDEDE